MGARFVVHLLLLATFAASLATVTLITEGWPHLVVGSAFVALAILHVVQRRDTVRTLWEPRPRPDVVPPPRPARVVGPGAGLLTINVLVSGTYDLVSGDQVILHPRSVGIPFRDIGWHVASALVLLVYLCVHVARRWGRIRRSVIR